MSAVETLAKVMLGGDDLEGADHVFMYEALQPLLAPPTFVALGAALELCPLHICDIQSCLDDGLHKFEVYDIPE